MNRIVVLVLVIAVLGGACYYAYSQYKKLHPPRPEIQYDGQMPMMPPMPPMMPVPPSQ